MMTKEKKTRAVVIDTSIETAQTLTQMQLYEGYRTMKEFVLRTMEFRYPELKSMVDHELRPRQGRPTYQKEQQNNEDQ
jgi:hypothetical protein